MSIHDKAEVRTQGPTSQRKAPSVDRFRKALYPKSVVGDEIELPDDLGEPLPKPHTMTAEDMAKMRRETNSAARSTWSGGRASVTHRDASGQAVRRYDDGTTEPVDG